MDHHTNAKRKRWLSILTKIHVGVLEQIWQELDIRNTFTWVRAAETGAVMVRGRMGGNGARFNMGEMTVTRATVRFDDGTVGFGYTAGRAHRKAELVALLDAAFQRDDALADQHLEALAESLSAGRQEQGRKAAATKVEFFTLVRGENPQ